VPRFINRVGARFGRLVVVSRAEMSVTKRTMWNCLCDCGNRTVVDAGALVSGATTSCRCWQRESSVGRRGALIHGMSHSRTYCSWKRMIERCEDEDHLSYPRYGGRGVRVCDSWRASFVNFLNDMGERPVGKTLDRINGAKNYEPSNCRWATPKEQAMNRPGVCLMERDGEIDSVHSWSKRLEKSRRWVKANLRPYA
jgi:hypothetical protein